jgi:hypothetical protein
VEPPWRRGGDAPRARRAASGGGRAQARGRAAREGEGGAASLAHRDAPVTAPMARLLRAMRALWQDYNAFGRQARRRSRHGAAACPLALPHAPCPVLRRLTPPAAHALPRRAQELETLRERNAAMAEQIRAVRAIAALRSVRSRRVLRQR